MKQFYFKFALSLFAAIFVSACSNDGGDGKDEKGDKQSGVAPASGALVQEACALRQKCYLDLLARKPQVVDELKGQNPYLLETWEKLDLNQISFAPQVLSCRSSNLSTCE